MVQAEWLPVGGVPLRVALKLMIGQRPDGYGGRTTRSMFDKEVGILQHIRSAFDEIRTSGVVRVGDARAVGLAHLAFTFCTGCEESAADVLPLNSPPGAPLYFIAMEPLMGGTLWTRLRRSCGPLDQFEALRSAKDLAAALAALHSRGIAHADLK